MGVSTYTPKVNWKSEAVIWTISPEIPFFGHNSLSFRAFPWIFWILVFFSSFCRILVLNLKRPHAVF